MISIHAPRAGGDALAGFSTNAVTAFQSTPPVRGATYKPKAGSSKWSISIHAPRAGGDTALGCDNRMACGISIHAPRAGGDSQCRIRCRSLRISIHAPRAGGDPPSSGLAQHIKIFQSTPPVRGATGLGGGRDKGRGNFNPRPPCGGRPAREADGARDLDISIHAPRAGGDEDVYVWREDGAHFNPRPPCGGRHVLGNRHDGGRNISIHAPRAGGDPEQRAIRARQARFQSTPPVRGATQVWHRPP